MTRPEFAYAWALQRRCLLNDESFIGSTWEDEHSNDPRWSATRQLAMRRADALVADKARTQQAIGSLWIEQVSTGYVATSLHPTSGEFAVLTDTGLQYMIDIAANLIARHYREPEFGATQCPESARESFGRLYQALTGQFYLYGRLTKPVPVEFLGNRKVAQRVAQEASLFVLAHELGHAVAATQHQSGRPYWLDADRPRDDLSNVAVEIEADAFGVALCLADCWGSSVGEAEVTLRILAIRLVLHTMEIVEAASLVSRLHRHLPATDRWRGLHSCLDERFPDWLLARIDSLWDAMAEALTFPETTELAPPLENLLLSLERDGWIDRCELDAGEEWMRQESLSWQFRLPLPILEYLIGADAVSVDPDPQRTHIEVLTVGTNAVTELLSHLPPSLVGDDSSHARATSGDLIFYLRDRRAWPHPFSDGAPLPIHLMASAVHRRLHR